MYAFQCKVGAPNILNWLSQHHRVMQNKVEVGVESLAESKSQ